MQGSAELLQRQYTSFLANKKRRQAGLVRFVLVYGALLLFSIFVYANGSGSVAMKFFTALTVFLSIRGIWLSCWAMADLRNTERKFLEAIARVDSSFKSGDSPP